MPADKLVINGYTTNVWARRLATYQQTLGVMGHVGLSNNIIISKEKNEEFTQPIRIEVDYYGGKPNNPGLDYLKNKEK